MVNRIVEGIKEIGKVEQEAKFEGRNFIMILAPLQAPKPA
jgi:translation initiation factor IF-3